MQADPQEFRKLHQKIEAARAEALRLGNPTLQTVLTMGLLAVEDRIIDLEQDYARTQPQVDAPKWLVGAT